MGSLGKLKLNDSQRVMQDDEMKAVIVAIQIMEDMLLIMEVVLLMQVFVKVLVRILLIMIRRVFLGQCLDIVFH